MYSKDYLKNEQYKSSNNLNARIAIHERFSQSPVDFFSWVFEHYPFKANSKVLEVGAGTGLFWKNTLQKLPAGVELTLTDYSQGMLDTCRATLGKDAAKYELADVESLPYANESFDAVLAHFMLYHPASPTRAIGEVRRVLKRGGFFGVVTGSEENLKELFEMTSSLLAKRGIAPFPRMGAPFWEQNAEAQLRTAFSDITKDVLADSLLITDAQAVVDYVRSQYPNKTELKEDFFEEYYERVAKEIERVGHWKVTKRSVIYILQ